MVLRFVRLTRCFVRGDRAIRGMASIVDSIANHTGATKLSTNDCDPEPGSSQLPPPSTIWLIIFCMTGISIGMSFEFLQLHAGPARYETFFLAFLGYWAQVLTSGSLLLCTRSWRRGSWNRRNIAALVVSAFLDGAAQALNYVSQLEGGVMLFTIFQSSVPLFAALIAISLPWTPRLRWQQWLGVLAIVLGLMLTSIPRPIVARHSFTTGLLSSMLASFCLASSYPVCELVFRLTSNPPSEEMACFCGAVRSPARIPRREKIPCGRDRNSEGMAPHLRGVAGGQHDRIHVMDARLHCAAVGGCCRPAHIRSH